ncbi:uncharacterized protein LOC135436255 [Drosophila montana]|uniref:uncharacterized protein LOC135436255 n=1 Tax=Drosophila montana TaxID=40370 RepID=UPI00313E3F0C
MELSQCMYCVGLLLFVSRTGLAVDSTVKGPAGNVTQPTAPTKAVKSRTDTEPKPAIQPEKQVTVKAPDQQKQHAENQPVKPVQPVQPTKEKQPEKSVQPLNTEIEKQPVMPVQPVQPRNSKQPDESVRTVQPTKEKQTNMTKPQKQRRSKIKIKPAEKCQPTEVLTANKGCVNRDIYMQHILQRAWADENLDEAKDKAGLARSIECPEGQVHTPFGCTPERKHLLGNDERVAVMPSHLLGRKVFATAGFIPALAENSDETNILRAVPSAKPNSNTVQGTDAKDTVGHKTPRKFVYMPGRLLISGRSCRPYEVLGIKNRCIRKRGKVGLYKHRDHVYT